MPIVPKSAKDAQRSFLGHPILHSLHKNAHKKTEFSQLNDFQIKRKPKSESLNVSSAMKQQKAETILKK